MKTTYVKKMNAVNTAHGAKVTVVRRCKTERGWTDQTKRYLSVSEASSKRVFRVALGR